LPDNIDEITGVWKWIIQLIGGYNLSGYNPADAAEDIKKFLEGCIE